MKDLMVFIEALEKLGINIEGLTLNQAVKLKSEAIQLITERINDFDNGIE